MSILFYPGDYRYGIAKNKPTLPEGWVYVEKEAEWLIAIDPAGKKWFAGTNTLHEYCEAANGGVFVGEKTCSIP